MGDTFTPQISYDYLFKILLVGESDVGKSSMLLRFTDDTFHEKQLSTIGVDVKFKFVTIHDKQVKLTLWDTAGQERFRTLTKSYYRGAQGIILMYDTTNRRSFESMRLWIEDVRKHTHGLSIMMLVGNKIDKEPRDVSRKEGQEFALENSMLFIETSAKTREGVKDAFEELVMKILDTPPLLETATPVRKEIALDGKDEELSNAACC
eukprot:GHVO01065243.1.p1 GENE.GHVO01065243.1~~GHVO01065243.1.p1  ORF type:complete len:223 (+),score=27.89 GHVO01065243.1:51-671(+)